MSMVCFNANWLHYWKETPPMFCKMERGYRRAKREQVIKISEYFHQHEIKLLTFEGRSKEKGDAPIFDTSPRLLL